jgi:hypothetical protein
MYPMMFFLVLLCSWAGEDSNVLELRGYRLIVQTVSSSVKVFAKWTVYTLPSLTPPNEDDGALQNMESSSPDPESTGGGVAHALLRATVEQDSLLMLDPIDALCLCKGPVELHAARAAGYRALVVPVVKSDLLKENAVFLCYRRRPYLEVFLRAAHDARTVHATVGSSQGYYSSNPNPPLIIDP